MDTDNHQQQKVELEDITELCRRVAEGLDNDTPMLTSSSFSLFDSMSAVEILDPKMDPCFGVKCSDFDDLIVSHVSSDIDAAALSSILRQMIVYEAAYFDGAALLESINQCVYVWPQAWKVLSGCEGCANVLTVYCKDLVVSARLLRDAVLTADIFEDDDFHHTSIPSANESEIESSAALESLCEVISRESANLSEEVAAILKTRECLHNLLDVIATETRESVKSAKTSLEMCDIPGMAGRVSRVCEEAKRAKRSLEALKNVLQSCSCTEGVIDSAFQPDILKIKQNAPARTFSMRSYAESVSFMADECGRIEVLCASLRDVVSTSELDADALLSYMSTLSLSGATVLPRSVVWALLHGLRPLLPELVLASMVNRGIPISLTQSDLCHQWAAILGGHLWDTMRPFSVHRTRLGGRLEAVFERWGGVMNDAAAIDASVRDALSAGEGQPTQQWFTYWAMALVTGLMDTYLSVQMEMDLLAPSEICSFYWYWDYILSSQMWAVKKMRELRHQMRIALYESHKAEAEETLKTLSKGKNSKKSKQSSKALKEAKKVLQQQPPPPLPVSVEEVAITARSQVVKGLFQVHLELLDSGVVHSLEDNSFASAGFRFVCRYKAFQWIHNPPPLPHSDFLKTRSQLAERTAEQNVQNALLHFKNIKDVVERVKYVAQEMISGSPSMRPITILRNNQLIESASSLLKASVALSICCMRRVQTLQQKKAENMDAVVDKAYYVVLDRTHSACFPVPNVVEKPSNA